MLTRLNVLAVSQNNFTGTIPTELGSLTHLSSLWLEENRLSGTVPTTLASCTSLTKLQIYSNLLNGSIPNELCATFQRSPVPVNVTIDCESVFCTCGCTCHG
jgi:Leucine-rich repeat (LRR) protein